ncbi:hypothetical protein M3A49_38950 [Paraburkholderia sp. CNPSo 3076]|uniref:hypothetical protein n=1 Tax=unclassified Paraburkholderia TaxID=2615204 RepID=UPI00225ACAF2|nr:hypothetical protein [Paraburkholderia sp. CNPSo 3076]MCX5545347.1 hypothetical protein [Paraburkholderia sp. CNPSo 3076]
MKPGSLLASEIREPFRAQYASFRNNHVAILGKKSANEKAVLTTRGRRETGDLRQVAIELIDPAIKFGG